MRKALILGSVLTLAGCAYPSPKLVAQLDGLRGKPEAELIKEFGVPSRTYDTSGHRFLAYSQTRFDTIPGTPAFFPYGVAYGYGFGYGYGGGFGGFPPEIVRRDCEITFDLLGGVVQSYALRGNDC